jgi:trans-2-enoyl-CoA reductase
VPFIGGNDCIGVVMSVGAEVKHLKENDWVIPMKTGMGTWRSLAVWKEKDLRKLPSADLLPLEYAAMLRACPRAGAFVQLGRTARARGF